MSFVLFDNAERTKLYPLTKTCAVAELRMGLFTLRERWAHITKENVYIHTESYLSHLYEPLPPGTHVWIDANLVPDENLIERIFDLKENEAIADSFGLIACYKSFVDNSFSPSTALQDFKIIQKSNDVKRLEYPWQIFQLNDKMLRKDFDYIMSVKKSAALPENNQYINPERIFIDEGTTVNFSIINASTGPVYMGKNSTVMEGSMIRGPFALCENAMLKMGTKIYGATTLGPYCVGGGEIKNVVMQGYSNKAHDGYLGDSVIGRWCNLGAGTSNSNVKNTGGMVKIWNAFVKDYISADVKCGVIMGDYSRTAINTSLNTGTIIGVCCNIFGEGLPPKYVPDFQWGFKGNARYDFEKSLQDIANWKKMKDGALAEEETKILKHIFEQHFL
jgi:UDP-N-acetylglucosamine diphosphorylase / glucose-1-phosphate thymidylyltransferase / UDP-N-acetylgalactosamine diphosphorylase / glucosamine-1-phosphate N-acetyltransferase / galactosamine-1-phosphate N-acetyltransferase